MENNKFKFNKPKSTSRSAPRGAPSSAPRIAPPRVSRGMSNGPSAPFRSSSRPSPRSAPRSDSAYSSSYSDGRSSSRSSLRPAPRIAPADAPRIAPRITAKASIRVAPDSAPRITPVRIPNKASNASMKMSSKNNSSNHSDSSSNSTSWGKEADWYDDYLHDDDSYQKQIIMPNLLRIINPTPGKKILDLACGQGLFSEAILEKGANVTGVDISEELINIAKNRLKNIISKDDSFIVSPADKILSAGIKEATCDSAICVLAAQNIKEFDVAVKETSKVLKPKGKFVLVLNHPCFRIPKNSDWHFDAEGGGPEGDPSYIMTNGRKAGRYGRVIYSYMSEGEIKIDMHPGEQDRRKKSYTTSFHRSMQIYSKWLANAGFAILRIEEWVSHKKSNPGSRESADKRAKKEIPLFMCIEAVLMD